MQKRLDFRAGDDRGRIYRVLHQDAPSGPVPRLGQASTQELVEGLESVNAWWRLTCQRLILERADRTGGRRLLDSWSTRLVREAESSPGKAESRADAIAVLAINPSPEIARRLSRLLGPQSPHQVGRAVVRLMLASSNRTSSLDLLDGWSSFSAPVRDEILSQVMIEPKLASRLLDAVETGRIGVTELGTTRRRQLLDFPAEKVRKRARTLLANSPDVEREETITQLVQQLGALEGNVDRGRDVFMAECATCHNRRTNSEGILYKGKGGNVAPDLGAIRSRSSAGLLSSHMRFCRMTRRG